MFNFVSVLILCVDFPVVKVLPISPPIEDDTESKRAFRSMYPEAPVTNVNLEAQQDAMLRQQEATLRAIREGRKYLF